MATLSESKPSKVLSEIWFKGSPKIQIDLNRINKLASLGLPRRVPCNAEDSPPPGKACTDSSEAKKRKAEIDARDLEWEGEGGLTDQNNAEAQNRKAIDLAKEILSVCDKDKENIKPGGEYFKGVDVRKHVSSSDERSAEKKRVLQVSNRLQNSLPSSGGSRKVGSLLMKQSTKLRVRKDSDCSSGGSKLPKNRDEDSGSYKQQIDGDMMSHMDTKNNSRLPQFIDASRHVDMDGERGRKCNEIVRQVGSKPFVTMVNSLEARHEDRQSQGDWYGTLKEFGTNPPVSAEKYVQHLQDNKENQVNWYETSKEAQSRSPISVANQSVVVQNHSEREGKWYETVKHVGSKPPISCVNHLVVQNTDRASERKWCATSKEDRSNPSISVDKYVQILDTNRENQENWSDTSKEADTRPSISVANRLEVLQNEREREGKGLGPSKEIAFKLPMVNCSDVQHADRGNEGKWYKASKEAEPKAPISIANYLEAQESSMSSVILESEQKGPFSASVKQLSSSMNGSVRQLSSYMNGLTIIDTSFHDMQTSIVEEKGGLKNDSDKDLHGIFGTELKHSTHNCQGVTSDGNRSSIPVISSTTCSITVRTSSAPLATSYTDENVEHLSPKNMQSLARFSPIAADRHQVKCEIQSSSNSVMEGKEVISPVKIALPESRPRKPADEILVSDIGSNKIAKKTVNQGDVVLQPRKHVENENMVVVNGKKYQKLKKIGRGGSSEVFKVLDREHNIYALKRIKLKGRDYGTARGFYEEIELLTRLQGKKYIIRLIDHEVTDKTLFAGNEPETSIIKHDVNIYMVLEFGEVDLATMLQEKLKEKTDGNHNVDEDWLRFYWKQILEAVNTVHEGRIMHGDLKPANFMLVKGVLKLIDFGIAKSIQSDTTNIERESQVGTLNYMSPEAFLMNEKDENGNVIKCGRSSDIWALGCILYQMVYGKTPFAHITSLHAKIQEVANPRHKINYLPLSNPHLLDIMKRCLAYNRDERSRIPELLKHPFLQPERDVGGKVEAEIMEEIRAEEARGRDTAALRRVLRRVKMLSL